MSNFHPNNELLKKLLVDFTCHRKMTKTFIASSESGR